MKCLQLAIIINLICIQAINGASKEEPQKQCGRALESNLITATERIVGGYDVGYFKYPWFAALIENNMVECGGTLIAPKVVVTAAHCYKDYLNKTLQIKLEDIYKVRMGLYNICMHENTTRDYQVEKVQLHELYLTKNPYFDIALLTLANSTDPYQPICLPNGVVTHKPREGTVPGMGTLRFQGPVPCTLHEARLLIYSEGTCAKMINDSGNNASQVVHAFCAGYLSGGIDTCQGDSGGPLQVLDQEGRYTLLGLVSYGFHCALPNYLGVYTDVSHFVTWIKEKGGFDDINFLHSVVNDSTDKVDENFTGSKGHHTPHHHPHRSPLTIIILRNKAHQKPERKKKASNTD